MTDPPIPLHVVVDIAPVHAVLGAGGGSLLLAPAADPLDAAVDHGGQQAREGGQHDRDGEREGC